MLKWIDASDHDDAPSLCIFISVADHNFYVMLERILKKKTGEFALRDFVPSVKVKEAALNFLKQRGVELEDIAQLTYFLQEKYVPDLTIEQCIESVGHVLQKREVQNAIITGIELDILAEKGLLSYPLQDILQSDEGLYGVDEILALSILNLYGSIGYTNYGYIDKLKHGILERLNDKSTGEVHTFLDDLVGAIAAAASSRIAHRSRAEIEDQIEELKEDLD